MIFRNQQRLNLLSTVIVVLIVTVVLGLNLIVSLYAVTLGYSESQQSAISQIARTFDITLSQIEDSVYSASLDTNLEEISEAYSAESNTDVLRLISALRSIHLRNRYFAEVAMIFPRQQEIVLSAQGIIRPFSDYTDGQFFEAYAIGPTLPGLSQPRQTIVKGELEGTYMAIVSPVPLSSRRANAILIAYIDIEFMFREIVLRSNPTLSSDHIVDIVSKDRIILSTDPRRIQSNINLTEIREQTDNWRLWTIITGNTLRSLADSTANRLGWTFITETPSDLTLSMQFVRIFSMVLIPLSFFVFFLGRFIYRSSKTYEAAFVKQMWARFLTNPESTNLDVPSIPGKLFDPGHQKCGVIGLKLSTAGKGVTRLHMEIEACLEHRSGLVAHILVPLSSTRIDLVVFVEASDGVKIFSELAETLQIVFHQQGFSHHYVALSNLMDRIESLPKAEAQCREVLKYKLNSAELVMSYQELQNRVAREVYPFEIENKLLNGLSLGEEVKPGPFIREFFAYLNDSNYRISDEAVRSFVVQLGVNLQRFAIVKLGVSVALPDFFSEEIDLLLMETMITEFVKTIQENYAQLTEGSGIEEEIAHFIDSNFSDPNLNLNHVANTLGIHRNQVSKIVKRVTGMQFIEYLHFRRVEYAKLLLNASANITIASIGKDVGFSYTHHFIRVFKNIEGVTPGQFQQTAHGLETS